MTVTAELVVDGLPENLRDLAVKWSEAVSASLDILQSDQTTAEDASGIIDIALHSVAAILAPGEFGIVEHVHVVNRFSQALADVCAAFREDKAAAKATRQ